MKAQPLRSLFLPLLLAIASPVWANEPETEPHFKTIELAPDLYMLIGQGGFLGGNIGVSVGPDGLMVIDGSMPPFLSQLTAALAEITPESIDLLINTHIHQDHIGNNAALAATGARIIAHEAVRSRLLAESTADSPIDPAGLPVITFTDEMKLYLNGHSTRLLHLPDAHTDGDVVILFPASNVVHAGDIFFHGMFPFIDLDKGGTVDGFIAAQEALLSLCDDETKIIPGHGPLGTKADLARDLAVLKDARTLVAALIAADHGVEAIVEANPLAKYHDDYNWGFITTERMTRTLYRDIVGP